jgi:hypothetical protein
VTTPRSNSPQAKLSRHGKKGTPKAKRATAPKPAKAKAPRAVLKHELPQALAKHASALHEAKLRRLRQEARELVERIRQAKADIAGNMVDIGLALASLKREGMAEALGRKNFADVCEGELEMSVSAANALVSVATKVPRHVVASLGHVRAHAVLELVEATPEEDSPEDLMSANVRLPSGRTLDVANASIPEIRAAAREFRDALLETGKRSRGFTASASDKKAFAALAKRLGAQGHAGATLVAARDGKGAKVRFEVRLSDVRAFATALRAAASS